MEIKDWLGVFWKRKGVVIICICVALFAGAIYGYVYKKAEFQAVSKILVQQPPRVVMMTEKAQHMTSPLNVETQRRLLASLPVAKKAATIILEKRASGNQEISEEKIINEAEMLLEKVKSDSDENTGIITISMISQSPQDCAELVNAYAQAFEQITREMMDKSFRDTMDYLETQLKNANESLLEKEKMIFGFNEKNGVIKIDMELQEKNKKIIEFEMIKLEAEVQAQAVETRLNSFQDIYRDQTIMLAQDPASLTGNPGILIQQLNSNIVDLEIQRNALLAKYKENHPEVVKINRQIEGYQRKLEDITSKFINNNIIDTEGFLTSRKDLLDLNIEYILAKSKISFVNRMINEMKEDQKKYPRLNYELNQLEREKLVAEKMYLMLYEQYQQTKIEEVKRDIDIQVFEKASVPKTPISPNRGNILVISLVMGVLLGVMFTVLLEEMEETIRTSEDVKNFLNLPVLGSIPYSTETINKLITDVPLKSPIAEAYRRLSFFTQLLCIDPPVKSLLVTSSKSDEGKSTTLSNLAISMAQEGTKVLIVDSDLRRPMLHRMFGVDNSLGISSILSGELEAQIAVSDLSLSGNLPKDSFMEVVVDRLIQPTSIKGLSIIPSGPLPANSIELIRSEKMLSFLRCIEKKADIVIFDSPPAIHVIDSVVLAQILDGVLFVINSGRINKTEAIQVKYMIESTKTPIIGVTLNNIEASSPDYYYYYYYGGYGYGSRQRRKRVKLKR